MRITAFTLLFFLAAVLLFLMHNHADYLLQAYQHGWETWWDLHGRAVSWPWYLDVLPRDNWHLVQTIRNQSVIAASMIGAVSMASLIDDNMRYPKSMWHVLMVAATPFALYAITRAIAFSLIYAIMN